MTDILKDTATNLKINENKEDREFVWKGPKFKDENGNIAQESVNLMDANIDELRGYLTHCNSMLYNTFNRTKPGRYVLLNIIDEQISKCNAELLRRVLDEEYKFVVLNRIKKLIYDQNINPQLVRLCESNVFDENTLDPDYSDLNLSVVCDALTNKLGLFDKSHLTLTFFMKQGIWFTSEEYKEMLESDLYKDVNENKIEYVRRYLRLPLVTKIVFNSKGFSLNEMSTILSIKSRLYSKMETEQLEILRNVILFALRDEVKSHAESWEQRINTIMKVAKKKQFKL